MHILTYIPTYFSSITGDLANLTEPFALMASETKPAPLYCLKTVTTSGMTNLATPEDNLSVKICPFPTLILSGTRTLESTSLKISLLIHSCIHWIYSKYPDIYVDAAKKNQTNNGINHYQLSYKNYLSNM